MSTVNLLDFPEDVLIYLLSFLSVPGILCVRQTCRQFEEVTNLSIVWINAWETHIFCKGYPFPSEASSAGSDEAMRDAEGPGGLSLPIQGENQARLKIQNMSRAELEQRTRHAYRLAMKWQYGCDIKSKKHTTTHDEPFFPLIPRRDICWAVSPSTPITDVRFVRSVRRSSSSKVASASDVKESVLVLTIAKGIWSVITIWDVPLPSGVVEESDSAESQPRKCAEWSPKGGIFTGLCLSGDDGSEADLAVSVVRDSIHEINLFVVSDEGELLPICAVPAAPMREINNTSSGAEDDIRRRQMHPMKPMTLSGTTLAMSDDTASTVIYDWKTGAFAALEHEEDEAGVWKQDHIIQVVFAYKSILVVRARSMHLFPYPELGFAAASPQPSSGVTSSLGLPVYSPIANHSFGWVDGVSVVRTFNDSQREGSQPGMLKILVRSESDNPWTANQQSLDLYELYLVQSSTDHTAEPSGHTSRFAQSPYSFPPICTSKVTSTRGSLRCTDIILGKCGTAIWVKPGDRTSRGLLTSDVYDDYGYIGGSLAGLTASDGVAFGSRTEEEGGASESLVAGMFPGPLNPEGLRCGVDGLVEGHVRTRKIYTNVSNDWTALDYDEAIGRVVLGHADGKVRILEL